jgi:hypothetical protein
VKPVNGGAVTERLCRESDVRVNIVLTRKQARPDNGTEATVLDYGIRVEGVYEVCAIGNKHDQPDEKDGPSSLGSPERDPRQDRRLIVTIEWSFAVVEVGQLHRVMGEGRTQRGAQHSANGPGRSG